MQITDTFATIWEISESFSQVGKLSVNAKLSTGRKLPNDAGYANSNWFARFVGACAEDAKNLQRQDKIKITKGIVTCEPYEKDGKKTYPVKVTVFGFERSGGSQNSDSGFHPAEDTDYSDTPF